VLNLGHSAPRSSQLAEPLLEEMFGSSQVSLVGAVSDIAVICKWGRIVKEASWATETTHAAEPKVLDLELEQAESGLRFSWSELIAAVGHKHHSGGRGGAEDDLPVPGDELGVSPGRRGVGERFIDVGYGLVTPAECVPGISAQPEAAEYVEYFVVGQMRPDSGAHADEVVVLGIESRTQNVIGGLADAEAIAVPTVTPEHKLETSGHFGGVAGEGGEEDDGPVSHACFLPSVLIAASPDEYAHRIGH